MKGYKTEKINYAGCHPVIAEALKNNEMIFCKVWDGDSDIVKKEMVIGFFSDSKYPYRVCGVGYEKAIPIKTERVFKSFDEIVEILLSNGWKITKSEGCFVIYCKNHKFSLDLLTDVSGKFFDDYSHVGFLRLGDYLQEDITEYKK